MSTVSPWFSGSASTVWHRGHVSDTNNVYTAHLQAFQRRLAQKHSKEAQEKKKMTCLSAWPKTLDLNSHSKYSFVESLLSVAQKSIRYRVIIGIMTCLSCCSAR